MAVNFVYIDQIDKWLIHSPLGPCSFFMSVSLSFYLYGCVVILCNFAHDYALAGYQYAKRIVRWKYFLDLVLYII